MTVKHPEWRIVVDLLSGRPYGSLVTYQEIASAAGIEPQSRRFFAQMARAARELLQDWQRELENVPRIGYRLVGAVRVPSKEPAPGAISRRTIAAGGALPASSPDIPRLVTGGAK